MTSIGLAMIAALLAAPSAAEENPGAVAVPALQVPMGSRALGMGSAFTAVASDASALYYNPAGLSRLAAHEASLSFISGLSDNTLQYAGYGGPLPLPGIFNNGFTSVGGSVLVSNAGSIEVNRTNADGSFLGSQSLNAGVDVVATLAYSERVAATPIETRIRNYAVNHFVGVSGKYVNSTLAETYHAQTVTADFGYLVHSPEAGLSLGLSALNVGGRLRYVDDDEPLPTILRGGLAFQGGIPAVHSVTVAADAEHHWQEGKNYVNAGVEYFMVRTYGIRVGYQFLRDTVGLTMGLGLRWKARILFDYAWAMADGLNDSHRVTISYRFGGVASNSRGRGRRTFIESMPGREQLQDLDQRRPVVEPEKRPRLKDASPGNPGWIY